jgi:hypothetical protein
MKRFLSLLWTGWKKFAHVLGIVNTKILLTLSYFLIMAVAAIAARILGKDLLDRKITPGKTQWQTRDNLPVDLETSRRQF